jgi:hypothetical protein
MKVSGANPVHALFAMLRQRIHGAQKLPEAQLRPEASQQARDTVQTARSLDTSEETARIDSPVVTPNDDAMAVAVARLRSNISFAAADGVNKLNQFESGRSWELATPDIPAPQPHSKSNPHVILVEGATRFTPSPADISEAMEVLAALNSRPQLYGSQMRQDAKSDMGWKQMAGRAATIFLGVSILIVVLSAL